MTEHTGRAVHGVHMHVPRGSLWTFFSLVGGEVTR